MIRIFLLFLVGLAGHPVLWAQSSATHFEARHTRPMARTPDGTRLVAVHPDGPGISVFDISDPASPGPVFLCEIPVGIAPVAVAARTNDEVWVVNEVSDAVSIVSLSQKRVVQVLSVPDEPADVVFAGGRAFVSCARGNQIRVFDAVTRAAGGVIATGGMVPRALAVSPDGTRVFAAFLHSGNQTTILPAAAAPVQPAPTNPALPAPPKTGLIVPATDPRVSYTVLDRDVVELNAAPPHAVVRYFSGAGTNLFYLDAHPVTGSLWVLGTEAHNQIRFEPQLNGRFAQNRLAIIVPATSAVTISDLNPGVDPAVQPKPAARAQAMAQPHALVFTGDGGAWVAGFGSDRLARLDANGQILSRVDLRPEEATEAMRGPRGLVLDAGGQRLFVWNKLSGTLTTIDAATGAWRDERPLARAVLGGRILTGRKYLFDARLSGNGSVSCATCHLDADRDGIAWDLGDPGGDLVTMPGAALSAHMFDLVNRVLHPMKGPMTTQTLVGMAGNVSSVTEPAAATATKFHWRGDKPSIQSFNSTFPNLLAGEEIDPDDMDALTEYLLLLRHHPNPNRNPDRTLSTSLATPRGTGSPAAGVAIFNNHDLSHCITCHAYASGTDQNIDLRAEVGSTQDIKTAPLRTVYQRAFMVTDAGQSSPTGFGLLHDGTGSAKSLPIGHPYVLHSLTTLQQVRDLTAFVLSFDTGTAPAVGRMYPVDASNRNAAATTTELAFLEAEASKASPNIDLIARGRIGGVEKRFRYHVAASAYLGDAAAVPAMTRAALLSSLGSGDYLLFQGVLPGTGPRWGGDLDLDGIRDADELPPVLRIGPISSGHVLRWTEPGWALESAASPAGPWSLPVQSGTWSPDGYRWEFVPDPPSRFFRLRRSW